MNQAKAIRSTAKKQMQSMPDNAYILEAGESIEGSFGGFSVFEANFPDDDTSFEINGKGINLSALNGKVPDGWTFLSHFTKVSVPAESNMVLIVYGF